MQAILAVGAGSMAVNAVKGVLGGGDKAEEEVDKHAKKASSGGDDSISKALESLRKSGKAVPALIPLLFLQPDQCKFSLWSQFCLYCSASLCMAVGSWTAVTLPIYHVT